MKPAARALSLWLLSGTALAVATAAPGWAAEAAQPPPAAPATGAPTQATAQPTTQLEEVVVTAQKRRENLQAVPIAVQAFSAQKLAASNITGLTDLVNVTPSLRFSFSAQSGSLFLRGVGNGTTFAGSESEVQLYIDNVYYASAAGNYQKFDNVDRIEVDKGPQGTLFGRNATGGVIQIFTRDPTQTPRLDASFGYGNYNAKQGDIYASRGFTDQLAGDIAVHYEDHDGWGHDPTTGKPAFAADDLAIRSKWVYTPSNSTKVTLIANYGADRSDLGAGLTEAHGGWTPSLAVPVTSFDGFYNPQGNDGGHAAVHYEGGSLKIDQKLGDLTFVSITAGEITKSYALLDGDGTAAPVIAAADRASESQISQEFQLVSPSTGRLKWILGAYLYYNDAAQNPAPLYGEAFSGPPFFASSIEDFGDMKTDSAALFGQATYDLTPTTHITGGIRYTYDHRSQSGGVEFNYLPSRADPAGGPGPPPAFLGLNQNNYPHVHFEAPTGKITLSQDFAQDVMAYIGYSRGYKAGIYNNLLILANRGPALQPEYIDAYEGGLKTSLFDHRLRLNFSAFYYKYSNLQVTIFQTLNVALQNAASATIKGLEAEGEFALTPQTRLSGGVSYLNAKYDDFPDAPLYTLLSPNTAQPPSPVGVGGFGGVLISSASAAGNNLPQAPDFSGYASINHVIETGYGTFNLNSTLNYQSRVYFTPDNLFSQRGYANLGASVKWTNPTRRWDVTVWARNLTDVHTYASQTVSGYINGGVPNEPRVYGAKVGVHF